MTNAQYRQRGISLLEALIAVALLAALSSMLAPAINNTLRLSIATLRNAEARESHRIAEDALTQILSNAVIIDPSEEELRIHGDVKQLHVVSLAGSSTARRFTLRIEGGRLVGDINTLLDGAEDDETTEILKTGAVEFTYYGRATNDAPLSWSTNWPGALPPQLVQLRLASNDNALETSSIEIPVAVRGPIHCAFDPVSRRCRD